MFLKIGGCQIIAAFCSVPININVTTCRETSTSVRYAGEYMFISVSAASYDAVRLLLIRYLLSTFVWLWLCIFYDCMYNCQSNILSPRLSIVLYIVLGLAHALCLASLLTLSLTFDFVLLPCLYDSCRLVHITY